MQENQSQISVFTLLHKAVYIIALVECTLLFMPITEYTILNNLLNSFSKISFLRVPNVIFVELFLILLIVIGTKPQKKLDINIKKEIVFPTIIGLICFFLPLLIIKEAVTEKRVLFETLNYYSLGYIILKFVGIVFTINGLSSIFKIIKSNLGKDRFNIEEESFEQESELKNTPYSLNIPTRFFWKKKWNDGWLNIDLFRGSIVIGTPGSGKSFGIINPAIKQTIAKGFSMLLYDLKYPDLTEIAYYHYLKKKAQDKSYNHQFYVVNPQDVEASVRLNPIRVEYIKSLASAQDIAESIVLALQKGGDTSGSGQFFQQSAINFMASCIYFLSKHKEGKFCDLPHLMALLNLGYNEIFQLLFSIDELESLLSPFKSAFENQAFDQLEGQIGTLKIFFSRLATKENYWVFSEGKGTKKINFKVSDKVDPSILVLASSPESQNINSAIFSTIITRVTQQINTKGNLPSAVIADEFPTVYFHAIENTIATARSNKVAVLLGLQELTQLRQYYKKEIADTLSSVIGNIFSGSVREKNTLSWIEALIGKAKQITHSMSVSQNGTSITTNEKFDFLVPQAKIATLKTGQMVGVIADSSQVDELNYINAPRSAFNAKINLDLNEIKKEEIQYKTPPIYYEFINSELRTQIATNEQELAKLRENYTLKLKKNKQKEALFIEENINQKSEELKKLYIEKTKQIDAILVPNFNKINAEIKEILYEI